MARTAPTTGPGTVLLGSSRCLDWGSNGDDDGVANGSIHDIRDNRDDDEDDGGGHC